MKRSNVIVYSLLYFLVSAIDLNAQENNLVAHWTFNENDGTIVTDVVSQYKGELMGETSFASEAIEGSSVEFIESTDHVMTDLLEEIQSAENITFMAWFNTNVIEGQQHILWIGDIAANGWGTQQELHITINHFNENYQEGNLCLFYGSSADTDSNHVNIVSAETDVNPGEWHHVAAVIKNMSGLAEAELYLDGVLLTPTDWSATELGYLNTNVAADTISRDLWNSPLLIGIDGKATRGFKGFIDEVKVYDTPLTESEIIEAKGANTSISVMELANNLVYPNPVKNTLFINNLSDLNSIEIYDVQGSLLLTSLDDKQIDVSNLQKGIYLVKIVNEKQSSIQKIIKQ